MPLNESPAGRAASPRDGRRAAAAGSAGPPASAGASSRRRALRGPGSSKNWRRASSPSSGPSRPGEQPRTRSTNSSRAFGLSSSRATSAFAFVQLLRRRRARRTRRLSASTLLVSSRPRPRQPCRPRRPESAPRRRTSSTATARRATANGARRAAGRPLRRARARSARRARRKFPRFLDVVVPAVGDDDQVGRLPLRQMVVSASTSPCDRSPPPCRTAPRNTESRRCRP